MKRKALQNLSPKQNIQFPCSFYELQNLIKHANKSKCPFSIQSRGKNLGYPRLPDGSLIIDLSKLNKIIDYNPTLGYLTIEPGVTFKQAYLFLKKKKSTYSIVATGGPPEGSIVATTMERGIGKGVHSDLIANCCALEILLPTGEVIHTGFSSHKDAKASHVHKYGYGTYLGDLFSQSNLGIVTKMTVWLNKKPEFYSFIAFTLKGESELGLFINKARELKMARVLEGNFMVSNMYKVIAQQFQYPWNEINTTPLPRHHAFSMAKRLGVKGYWVGQNMITGYNQSILDANEKTIIKELGPYTVDFQIVHNQEVEKLEQQFSTFKNYFPVDSRDKWNTIKNSFKNSVFLGVPQTETVRSLYWRKKTRIPKKLDPIKDNCGLLWINSVIPFESNSVLSVLPLVEKTIYDGGFEPMIGVNMVSERAIYLIISIIYDKAIIEEEKKAFECYFNIYKKMAEVGCYPYRASSDVKNILPQQQDDSSVIIQKLKHLFDPQDILQ